MCIGKQADPFGASDQREPAIAIFDAAHLANQTMGIADLQVEVLQMFLELAPTYLAGLGDDLEPAARRAAAHTLKGSARGIGAFQLGDLAEQFESALAAPDRAAFAELQQRMQQCFAATRIEINAMLKTLT